MTCREKIDSVCIRNEAWQACKDVKPPNEKSQLSVNPQNSVGQWCVCLHCAARQWRHLWRMDLMTFWGLTGSMAIHSACNAASSWRNVWDCHTLFKTLLSRSSQICSIGDKSVDSNGITSRFCAWRKSCAKWALALSCWKTVPLGSLQMKGTIFGSRTSSL